MNFDKLKSNRSVQELLEFGILNLDKPSGPTSFDISDFVRKILNELGVKKTSHFGTLDPKVTGVLPIALNRACKLTGFFLGEDKEYVGIMRIHKKISLEEIEKIIKEKFTGIIKQTPPKKSSVKRQEREREIKKFELLEEKGNDILFATEVQGGTYIRKLISDLGEFIGGAHMLELRRIRAGIFEERKSINLYDFEKAVSEFKDGNEKLIREIITPAEIVSEIYPIVQIKKNNLKHILTGKPIYEKDLVKGQKFPYGEIISVFSDEKFIGMYKVVNSEEIFAKAEFVMQEIKD
ncbi:MAG: RNA-guided pseudouridylation complex pseudouridine synthase subunit Cbf5 [Nanoarchaeota archaeon]